MKNLPLDPKQISIERNLLPVPGKQASAIELEKIADIAKSADASIVSLPRTKAIGPQASDANAVLNSFLLSAKDEKELLAAHAGIDASRVFDLLSDDE